MTVSPNVRSFLNQIFYSHNKFDQHESIEILKPWMLSNENIELWKSNKPDVEPAKLLIEPESKREIETKPAFFSPKNQDTLFWCIYVAHYGEAAYMAIGNKYKNEEIAEKQKIIAFIKTLKSTSFTSGLKISKVKLQEIAAGLMIDKKTDWTTFQIMCMFYKISAVVLNPNHTYLHIKSMDEESQKTYIFYKNPNSRFSIDLNDYVDTKSMTDSMVLMDHMSDRPLKAASAYKLEEIQQLAHKLGITIDNIRAKANLQPNAKPKKTDWYNATLFTMRE